MKKTVFVFCIVFPNSLFAQSIAEPSENEMLDAMNRALASAGGRAVGMSVEKISKVSCEPIGDYAFRCSYRSWIKANCDLDPLTCMATQLSNGKSIASGRFSRADLLWQFHGAGS